MRVPGGMLAMRKIEIEWDTISDWYFWADSIESELNKLQEKHQQGCNLIDVELVKITDIAKLLKKKISAVRGY